MADEIAVVPFTASGPTQDITDPGISTLRGAIIFVSGDTALDGSNVSHGRMACGIYVPADGADGEAAVSWRMRDGANDSRTTGYSGGPYVLTLPTSTASDRASASTITNGIRLTWASGPTDAAQGVAILFGGDLEMGGDTGQIAVLSTSVSFLGLTADPDWLMMVWHLTTLSAGGSSGLSARGGLGFSDRVDEMSLVMNWDANTPELSLRTDRLCGDMDGEGPVAIDSFDGSGGFTATADAGSPNYLAAAIRWSEARMTSVTDHLLPTSTGSASFSTGHEPELVILALSLVSAETPTTGPTAGGIAFVVLDGTTLRSYSMSAEDGAAISESSSRAESSTITLLADDGTVAFEASLTSIDSDGFTLNVTTAASGGKLLALSVGSPLLPRRTVEGVQVADGTRQKLTAPQRRTGESLDVSGDTRVAFMAMTPMEMEEESAQWTAGPGARPIQDVASSAPDEV